MVTHYGTANFRSRKAAIRYYATYEPDPAKAVDRKLAAGEIYIGPPKVKPGESWTWDRDGRAVVTVK